MLVAPARLAAAAALLASLARPARAEPRDLVARPLVLARGEVEARLVAELSVSRGALAAPFSLAPDAWLGLGRRWTVGVVHSAQSLGLLEDGATLCFRGSPPFGCDRAYTGSGVDVRWGWRAGALAVAPRGRLVLRDVDPWKPAVTAGALARWTRGRFAVAGRSVPPARPREPEPRQPRGARGADLARRPARPRLARRAPHRLGRRARHRARRLALPLGLAVEARAAAHLHVAVEGGFRSLVGPQADVKTARAGDLARVAALSSQEVK